MADITLFNELKQLAEAEGMDLFGVVDANCFLDEKYTGKKPQDFFENIRSVVLLAAAVHNGAVEPLPAGRAEYTNTLMSATAFLRVAAYKVARRIEKRDSWPVSFPTKAASSVIGTPTKKHCLPTFQ